MKTILLPIRKVYSDLIFTGLKRVEYRKSVPPDIDRVLVYESRGCGMVVGHFDVKEIISDTPEVLWRSTAPVGGIGKSDFDAYFANRDSACAIMIQNPVMYDTPRPLDDYGFRRAPQNFVWIDREDSCRRAPRP